MNLIFYDIHLRRSKNKNSSVNEINEQIEGNNSIDHHMNKSALEPDIIVITIIMRTENLLFYTSE